jgi:hypothetical protein
MIRTASIGLGRWGQHQVRCIQDDRTSPSGIIRFTAAATRRPAKAQAFASAHDLRMLAACRRFRPCRNRARRLQRGELVLPAAAPAPVVQRIHAAVAAAVAEPDVRQQFTAQGLEGVAMPPAEFAAFVADQSRIAQEIGRRVGTR